MVKGQTVFLYPMPKWKAWDVTMASTLAESYVEAAATESGAVAEQAAQRKLDKCRDAFLTTAFNQLQ